MIVEDGWWWATDGRFTGSFKVENGKVTEAPPFIRSVLRGRTTEEAVVELFRRRFTLKKMDWKEV